MFVAGKDLNRGSQLLREIKYRLQTMLQIYKLQKII